MLAPALHPASPPHNSLLTAVILDSAHASAPSAAANGSGIPCPAASVLACGLRLCAASSTAMNARDHRLHAYGAIATVCPCAMVWCVIIIKPSKAHCVLVCGANRRHYDTAGTFSVDNAINITIDADE